ncbi:MAG: hypothetical protein KDC88_17180 [Ignavibacteriae bacterium]|nr:hypothetical protein [Ignavibacteriota bacterium]
MCGIMGYYSFGNTLPDKNKLEKMFTLLETRGRDASGFAFIDPITNKLKVTKAPIPSSKLVHTPEWISLSLPKILIAHTRMKTQGDPKNNMNNHPIFNKDGMAIVHNGMIHNDNEIFSKKIKRDAEVDSEAILAILSQKHKDAIQKLFDKIHGIFAVAVIDQSDPGKLLLIKKDNPIDIYYNSKDDILYFASEREIMQRALNLRSTYKRGFGIGEEDYHFYEMSNNHALTINKNGIESYKKYTPRNSYGFGYGCGINNYLDDAILMECPYCFGSTYYNWTKLNNKCQHCGQFINEEDIYV